MSEPTPFLEEEEAGFIQKLQLRDNKSSNLDFQTIKSTNDGTSQNLDEDKKDQNMNTR